MLVFQHTLPHPTNSLFSPVFHSSLCFVFLSSCHLHRPPSLFSSHLASPFFFFISHCNVYAQQRWWRAGPGQCTGGCPLLPSARCDDFPHIFSPILVSHFFTFWPCCWHDCVAHPRWAPPQPRVHEVRTYGWCPSRAAGPPGEDINACLFFFHVLAQLILCLLLFQGLQQLSVQWQSAWTVHPCAWVSQYRKFLFSRPTHCTPSVHLKVNLFPTPIHSSAWSSILPQSSGPSLSARWTPLLAHLRWTSPAPPWSMPYDTRTGGISQMWSGRPFASLWSLLPALSWSHLIHCLPLLLASHKKNSIKLTLQTSGSKPCM